MDCVGMSDAETRRKLEAVRDLIIETSKDVTYDFNNRPKYMRIPIGESEELVLELIITGGDNTDVKNGENQHE